MRQESPAEVSVVVFRPRSYSPPPDDSGYCKSIVGRKYPGSALGSHYVVGYMDDLGVDEAIVLYQDLSGSGRLPNLGEQFDALQGSGPDGAKVVALFFR